MFWYYRVIHRFLQLLSLPSSTLFAMMSVSAGSPINLLILCIVLVFFLPVSNAAQQQPLRAATAPKRVAVVGRLFLICLDGPYV